MKSKIGNPSSGLLLLCGLVGLFLVVKLSHAQQAVRVEQSVEVASDWDLVMQALEVTPPLRLTNAHLSGSFFTIQHGHDWPPLPGNPWNLPFWKLSDGFYIVDDRAVNYTAQQVTAEEETAVTGISKGGLGGFSMMSMMSYTNSTDLWIEIIPNLATNGTATNYTLKIHNTLTDIYYDVLASTNLSVTNGWFVFGGVLASNDVSVLPKPVWPTNTPIQFFLARASSMDTDGDGLPNWWELKNGLNPFLADSGSTGTIDGYKNPAGDGWSNLDKYRNGWNPNTFYTPAAPGNFQLIVQTNGFVQLFWDRALGNVTGYVLEVNTGSGFTTLASLGSATNNFLDTSAPVSATYRVKATYSSGNSAYSQALSNLVDDSLTVNARIVRGPSGKPVLIVSSLPSHAVALRISRTVYSAFYPRTDYFRQTWGDYFDPTVTNGTFDVALTNLVNGTYEIPTNQVPAYNDYTLYVTSVGHDGRRGNWTSGQDLVRLPFHDGSTQMKQNVSFLLRAGGVEQPFNFKIKDGNILYGYVWPEDFVYSSLEVSYGGYHLPNEFRPFEENGYFRNFALPLNNRLSSGLLDSGFLPTISFDHIWITNPPGHFFQTYSYVVNSNQAFIATGLSYTNSRWIYAGDQFFTDLSLSYSGIYLNSSDLAVMPSGLHNTFGLPVISAQVQQNSGIFATLYPGSGQLNVWDGFFYHRSHVYQEVTEPVLATVGHYFARISANTTIFLDPFPGTEDFSATNSTPLLIASVGEPIHFAGWARQRIVNGYTNKFAYLGQYFDKAYTVTNGVKTTNQTGILSEYGEFLPTSPGQVILTTRTNLDQSTNQVGEALVHVLGLNVDANHDGVMDRTFAGPDQTSPQKPFRFWINDDHDNANDDINAGQPDFQDGLITTARDLEDFARLWVTGVPTNQDLTVQISWRNETGQPAIKLYRAVEADGGIGYLTNATTASDQINYGNISGTYVGYGVSIGLIASGQSLEIASTNFLTFGRKHFLFEAIGIGSGELVLSIIRSNTVVGESVLYMDLEDVKALYERAYATNVTTGIPPSSLQSKFKIASNSQPRSDETPQLILFVHGINNTEFDFNTSSETTFKRLYWSGYQGRFAAFRWPCAYLPFENTLNPYNYNKGEFYAYKSAKAFKEYLDYLSTTPRLDSYTINILGHSQGNGVVGEALIQGGVFDKYILSQGAIPAECFDGSVPTLQKLVDAETNHITPHIATQGGYLQCFTNISGNIVNFFNTNDFALAKGTYGGLQANWEENQRAQKPESLTGDNGYNNSWRFNGTNSYRMELAVLVTITNLVTDSQEIRSMLARSRSRAVGAQNNVGGIIGNQIDLGARFGFGDSRSEHSAQFTRPLQSVWGYYDELILGFGMQLNVTR